jgi:hypothetical protein
MYIYNLTAVIDEGVFEAWQQWLVHSYLPAVNTSALVDNVQIMRVLDSTDRHYAIHHEISSAAKLSAFLEEKMPQLLEEAAATFGEKALFFGTRLMISNEGSI